MYYPLPGDYSPVPVIFAPVHVSSWDNFVFSVYISRISELPFFYIVCKLIWSLEGGGDMEGCWEKEQK